MKKYNRGFTLVEIIVTVTILAAMMAIAVPNVLNYFDETDAETCALHITELEGSYRYTKSLSKLSGESNLSILNRIVVDAYPGASNSTNEISPSYEGICKGNTIKFHFSDDGKSVTGVCSKHGSESDNSGASEHSIPFTSEINKWIEENGDIKDKANFYLQYYATHPVVKMSDDYKELIKTKGLNTTIKDDLYWWSYPVTDTNGNLQYIVTYANTISNPGAWTGADRGKISGGYVVLVNGKTYIRGNTGKTVEPGWQANIYQTEDALEAALIANQYIQID